MIALRHRLTSVVAALALATGAGAGAYVATVQPTTRVAPPTDASWITGPVPSSQVLNSGCVLRFTTKGISIHANASHQAANCKSVALNNKGEVVLSHSITSPRCYPVLSVQVTPDETWVARGLTAGPSGGTGKTTLAVAQNGKKLNLKRIEDYRRVVGSSSNLWYSATHSVNPGCRADGLSK